MTLARPFLSFILSGAVLVSSTGLGACSRSPGPAEPGAASLQAQTAPDHALSLDYGHPGGPPVLLRNHEGSVTISEGHAELRRELDDGSPQYTVATFQPDTGTFTLSYRHSWHSALVYDFTEAPVSLTPYL